MKTHALISALVLLLGMAVSADARDTISVNTGLYEFKVERFAKRQENGRPAIIVLSGSRGFGSAAYDEIGQAFMNAGLDVYLAHVLSPQDLSSISTANDAKARIEYYSARRETWVGELWQLVSMLRSQGYAGRIGLLGISLGAETAAIAVSQGVTVDAVVLVNGVPSVNQRFSEKMPAPFHLVWGSEDRVFPVSSAYRFADHLKRFGTTATVSVFSGGTHDFFLKPDTTPAKDAYDDVINFMRSKMVVK